MMNRKPFTYRSCRIVPETLDGEILVACNNSTNRYRRLVWRAWFPDGTWCRCGTKSEARRYVNLVGRCHGVIN